MAGLCNASAANLEKMVDEANALRFVQDLAEKLGEYGFSGNISLNLNVQLNSEHSGTSATARTLNYSFSR